MTSTQKTILAITSELPWPLHTGGHIRSYHLMNALAQEFDFHLITPVLSSEKDALETLSQTKINIHDVPMADRNPVFEAWRAGKAVLSGEPYVMFHRHNHAKVRERISKVLETVKPDAVYMDHLDPLVYSDLLPNVPVIGDMHNIYSRITERVATERNWPVSAYLAREAKLQEKQEKIMAEKAASVMAVSAIERDHFEALGNPKSVLIPNGVDCASFGEVARTNTAERPIILFIGALSWQPNAKAVEFLAKSVMPDVIKEHPDAILQIVGRNPSAEILQLDTLPNVEVHPNVPEITDYISTATVLAVPLDSGGGTRLKILEAFASRLPIVSTRVGCEGIECENRKHLWLAERDEFAAVLNEALGSPEMALEIAEQAHHLVNNSEYNWPIVAKKACTAIHEVLSGRT